MRLRVETGSLAMSLFELWGRGDQFSRRAMNLIVQHYIDVEADTGHEVEFDVIAICCDWTEYDTLRDAADGVGLEVTGDSARDLIDRMRDEGATVLVEHQQTMGLDDGPVVILNY